MNLRQVQVGRYAVCLDADTQPGQVQAGGISYESHIRMELERLLPTASGIFVDVGANAGIHSVSARDIRPDIHVIAIEVSTSNVSLLCQTVLLNRFDNFTILPVAASDHAGVMFKNECYENSACSPDGGPGYAVPWPCVSLDSLRLGDVSVVKIDVEGVEYLVFRGMDELLTRPANARPVVIFEFTPKQCRVANITPLEMLRYLTDRGYALTILDYLPGIRQTFTNPEAALDYVINTLGLDILDIMAH